MSNLGSPLKRAKPGGKFGIYSLQNIKLANKIKIMPRLHHFTLNKINEKNQIAVL
jgi:hypothetical protein